jgi:HK97 gp10 family phage protein
VKNRVPVFGLKELDRNLSLLSRAAAKGVLKRVLLKAARPMVETARDLAPKDKGDLAASIDASTKFKNDGGSAAFAKAMKDGLGRDMAVQAKRDALRANGGGSFAVIAVGPSVKHPEAHFPEYGTAPHDIVTKKPGGRLAFVDEGQSFRPSIVHHPGSLPTPYMRPAFEQKAPAAMSIIKAELGAEISKTVARLERRRIKRGG